MKKKVLAALLVFALFVSVSPVFVSAQESRLPDFSDDFESYEVSGDYIENDTTLTQKWDNNVFRGGEAVGMDSHIYNIGKIEYEEGNSGNKVLHLKNTTGADSFFYMGPAGDYRTKNFTVRFRVRFLTEDVLERSWVGISFRKQAATHYTGTNNLLFIVQRFVDSAEVTGPAFAIFDGGQPNDLIKMQEMYGDKLTLTAQSHTVSGGVAGQDLPWLDVRLQAQGNHYTMYAGETLITDCVLDIPKYDYFGYLSLNCCTANVLVDDFSVTIEDETLPPQIEPLPSPVVTLNEAEKSLEWEAVEGAGSYLVTFAEGNERVVYTNSCSLEELAAGEYDITVTALTENSFTAKDSAPSQAVHYVAEEAAPEEEEFSGCGASAGAGAVLPSAGLCVLALVLKKRRVA